MTIPCRVLMIYPKFVPNSFWNYTEACELVGAKYPAAPLGLITVAAMLPKHWDIRLVNRNTESLTDADLDWADLVMIGGMLNQQPDAIYLIDHAHLHGKPVRSLSLHWRAIFAWLPVHLRVLRYYRTVWSRAAHQDQRSDSR